MAAAHDIAKVDIAEIICQQLRIRELANVQKVAPEWDVAILQARVLNGPCPGVAGFTLRDGFGPNATHRT